MPRKKAKLSTRPYFTEAEYGMLHTICPTGEPTLEQIACLYGLFKSLHTLEEIHTEYTNFREQDKEWSARCARDKARGPTQPDVANRTFQSPNITPLFTFTVEDTKDLYAAGMRLLERSQKGKGNQLPSNNTSVHRHTFCELINFEKTKAGKAFQKLLDKHRFQSRIIEALEALWKSKAGGDRRTARRLSKNLRFAGFLNLMQADATQQGQGIEAHVDSDIAIGALVVCLAWDGWTLGLYEVDDQDRRHHVDIPEGTAVWVNGGCVHGVELNHRRTPRMTFNTFVYHAAAVDPTLSDLSRAQSRSKLQAFRAEQTNKTRAKRTITADNLKKQDIRTSARLE